MPTLIPTPTPLFEVCLESIDSAIAAERGGAQRVELCAALTEGGLTPSIGLVEQCRAAVDIDIMVMIRPRGGDFLYTDWEFAAMARDIERVKTTGVTGVVLGLLLADGRVDTVRTRELIELARPLQVTFHRAFDMTIAPLDALDDLIELGVDRLLTSGQAPSVPEGLPLIAHLVKLAADRITIMPGAGITPANLREVLQSTGVVEFHATAFEDFDSPMRYRNEDVYMGVPGRPEYARREVSVEAVRAFWEALGR